METNHPRIEQLIGERDVARLTGMSLASVRRWRLLRQGPQYMKIGHAVRYSPAAIRQFLATRPTGGEAVEVSTEKGPAH